MDNKRTIPFTNTRYSLFLSVKVGDDNSTDYTDSSTMYCLKEHENGYQYVNSDKSVQRTITLQDTVNCFFTFIFHSTRTIYIARNVVYIFWLIDIHKEH